MGLELTIYNGFCTDGNKVINSVKAAYLYADTVRVYDFYTSDIEEICKSFKITDKEEQEIEEYESVCKKYPFLTDDNYLDRTQKIPTLTKDELLRIQEVREKYDTIYDSRMDRYYLLKEYIEIQLLRKISSKQYGHIDFQKELKKMGVKYILPSVGANNVGEAYENLCTQYFDDKGIKIVNDEDILNHNGLNTSIILTAAYLSGNTLSSLPGFEEATIDEIIGIRHELNEYIIPYRSAIIRMAEKIKEVPSTDAFQQECLSLYISDIEPKVAAINAAIDDNNVFKNIAKKVVTNKETWASVGALVAAFATKGDIANAVSIGTATTLAGISIMEGIVSTLEEKKKIKDNEMFFLYEAGQRLKK